MATLPRSPVGLLLSDGRDTAKAGKRQADQGVQPVDNYFRFFLKSQEPSGVGRVGLP